jgi:pimeloyl-ACP methyl ester carboxylesterase
MKIQVGNIQFNVEDRGSGTTLLLIHGFPLNLEMWRPQIEFFSNQHRVIAIDLRGHGLTPPTTGPYSMDLLADDCAAVLAALGVHDPVVVCGFSMGGYISFALYRRHPELFSGLILTATRAGADTDQARANREKAIAGTKELGAQPVLDTMLKSLLAPETYQSNPDLVKNVADILSRSTGEGIVSALEGMKERADSTGLLKQIKVPTLIFHGADDQIISLGESETMESGIPNSRLEVVTHAGHLLNMEQPDAFNKSAFNFMESI